MAVRPVRHPVVDDDVALARPFLNAGVPDAEYDGVAPKGALCIDTTNGKLYINTGSKADNTWTLVGSQTA